MDNFFYYFISYQLSFWAFYYLDIWGSKIFFAFLLIPSNVMSFDIKYSI